MGEKLQLGAYIQTDSWMTRLDGRTKLVVGLIYMISVLFIQTPLQLALGLIGAFGLILLAKLPIKSVLCAIRPAVSMLLILGLYNLLIVARGDVLVQLGFIRITTQGLHIAVIFSLRMVGALICAAVLFLTTTPTQVTDAFEKLLQPFARFGLPARELALILSLMLRFIPLLAYEAMLIKDAQAMRGAGREGASFAQKLQALKAFLIALLSSSLRHAHGLARSLDARCYESGSPRTHYKPSSYHVQDGIAYAMLVIYLAGLIGTGAVGAFGLWL